MLETNISFYLNLIVKMVQRICYIFRILFENGVGYFTKNLLHVLVIEILAGNSDWEGLLLNDEEYKENCKPQ